MSRRNRRDRSREDAGSSGRPERNRSASPGTLLRSPRGARTGAIALGIVGLAIVAFAAHFLWGGSRETRPAARLALPAPLPSSAEPGPSRDDFVGAGACAACHQDQFTSWTGSTHGQAGGDPDPDRVIAAFDGTPIRFRDAVVVPELGPGGAFRFRVRWDDLPEQVISVDGVIGGGHMEGGGTQGFVTRAADGTLRFLPFDFARQQGVWFCNTGTRKAEGWVPITPELSLADCGDWPPVRVLGDAPGLATCQGCHGSRIEVRFDTLTSRRSTTFATLAIDCESCHGPGREHVALAGSGDLTTAGDLRIASLSLLDEDASIDVCLQCHALKDRLEPGYLPGAGLADHYSLRFPMLGEAPFLPDGRIRTFAYQHNHRFSDCYLNGTMTCVDCHDPHSQRYRDHTGRPLDGRFSDGQCTSCHASKADRVEEHTRHPAGSAGSQCVSCHMPYLQHPEVGGAIRFSRSDHTIPIPRPGQDEAQGIRSACASCHSDVPVDALARQVTAWWGELKPRDEMVTALMRARESTDPAEIAELALAPGGTSEMARFAGLALVLERVLQPDRPPDDRRTLERLLALAADSDVDTRSLALASLHYAWGEDPAVRRTLARELRGLGPDDARVRRRWSTALGFMGDRLRDAGRTADGVAVYRKALEVLPDDPRLLLNYGLALSAAGDLQGAVAAYRRSLAADPRQSMALVNLGLALERLGDTPGATHAYHDAIGVDPHNALPYFNLGNQQLRAQHPAEAAELYRQAVSIDPSLAQAHLYLARSYIFLGEYDRALAAVKYGLKFRPDDVVGQQMLADLSRAEVRGAVGQ